MKKNLLLVAALFAGIASYAQCEEVASLNEDFSDFTITTASAQAFPQQCWSSIGAVQTGPWIYTAQKSEPADKYVVYYTHLQGANVPGYVVSPELSTIDGEHQLSFDTYKLGGGPGGEIPPGNITVQIGLISDPASTADFTEVGTAFTVNVEATTYTVTIPASDTKKYIAFKILSDSPTSAAALDNVVYEDPCPAVTTLDEDFSEFNVTMTGAFPQNCWTASSGMPFVYIDETDDESNQYAVYYNMNTANAVGYLATPKLAHIDGTYQLSFDTFKLPGQNGFPAGDMTVQVGTIATAGDFASFVGFGEPYTVTETSVTHPNIVVSAEGATRVVFKIIGTGMHNAVAIDNVTWTKVPPVCNPVATIDEDFSDVEELEDICWSVATTGQMVGLDITEGGNAYVSFYSFFAANTFSHVVTPEISTLGEDYTFSFDAGMDPGSAGGTVTIQLGTVSNPADAAATFTAFGDAITVPETSATFTSTSVPSDAGNHIAFRISGSAAHVAAIIDNVKWLPTAGVNDLNKNAFSIFPNPTADKNVTINHNLEGNGTVNVYSLTGAKVFSTALNAASQNINLASLSAGMYIVKIESGNYSASKKLVIQ